MTTKDSWLAFSLFMTLGERGESGSEKRSGGGDLPQATGVRFLVQDFWLK
jgi:hypothetical protein